MNEMPSTPSNIDFSTFYSEIQQVEQTFIYMLTRLNNETRAYYLGRFGEICSFWGQTFHRNLPNGRENQFKSPTNFTKSKFREQFC